jgi:hypothetical protein
VRGERPTHPELLDWLATEFVGSGWSIKHMHRLMLRSATYQQSTSRRQANDPDNRLLGHMNRLRLEGEAVRDSLLAVSGGLDRRMGGPGTPIGVRRSVYLFARRNLRDPFLVTFDLPDSTLSCPKRERSTTAPQALTLLNAAEAMAASRALAAILEREPRQQEQIAAAYRRVLGRRPTAEEIEATRGFLAHSPLSEFCRALFNVSEFVYLD